MEQKNKKKIIFFIIALIVIIILDGLVLFGILSVVNKAPSPARLDNCDREVKIVTDGNGGLVAIENKVTDTKPVTQSYGKQRTNVIVSIVLLIIIDALVIVFFVCLYNARKSLIVPMIIVAVIILAMIGIIFISCRTYLNRAKSAASVVHVHAPVIYLYSGEGEKVNIGLEINGSFTYTYPVFDNGWEVTASPDGTLTDNDGNTYEYIIWEADMNMEPDLSRGFCVIGEETETFLEERLTELGLNQKERSDFIEYWLPKMKNNNYNVISFQTDTFNDIAIYDIDPAPDTIVRVNMLWYPSDEMVEIEEQQTDNINIKVEERQGFVFVEWGGEMLGE